MDWLYVWSPRYRFFHELMQSSLKDLSGFHIQPVFAEQHLFTRAQGDGHFLTGIPIKIYVIVNYIQRNLGKTFFFTDVDLIVLPEFSRRDLDPYLNKDITCMNEIHAKQPYNIGCLLIRCTPETLAFFQRVLQRIREEKLLDQDAFAQELPSFSGSVAFFDPHAFLQSNMLTEDGSTYKIIQCLCSEQDSTRLLVEKVLTIASAFDIHLLLQYLPQEVQDILCAEGWVCKS